MSQSYTCTCSQCHGRSKFLSLRSIRAHLERDEDDFKTIPAGTESAIFVKSCIELTTKLLSEPHGGTMLPNTAPDAGGTRPDGAGGTLFNVIT